MRSGSSGRSPAAHAAASTTNGSRSLRVAISDTPLKAGQNVTLSIRPENVELADDAFSGGGTLNLFSGKVDQRIFLGDYADFQIRLGNILMMSRAHPALRASVDETIHMRMSPDSCVVLHEGGTAATKPYTAD